MPANPQVPAPPLADLSRSLPAARSAIGSRGAAWPERDQAEARPAPTRAEVAAVISVSTNIESLVTGI